MVGKRILIVDDNRDRADLLSFNLAVRGLDVRSAYSASRALQLVRIFSSSAVIVRMPMRRTDGAEFTRALRGIDGRLVLVALCNAADGDAASASSDAGFDLSLADPTDVDWLGGMLSSVLRVGWPRAAHAAAVRRMPMGFSSPGA